MKWTTNQQKAIETIDHNILVSASAGAGKTTILVERLMKRILTDRVQVSEVLALTFTEAAAAEMKHRLQSVMNQRLNQEPSAFLEQQISLLETAHISTIHSFCLSIVQNYGYVLSLDPKQVSNLLDEASKSIMIQQVLDQIIDSQLKQPTETFYQLSQYFDPRPESFEHLKQAIFQVYKAAAAQPDSDAWYKQVVQMYQSYQTFDQMPDIFQYHLWQSLTLKADQLMDLLTQLEKHVKYFIDDSEVLAVIQLKKQWISQAHQAISRKNYDGFYHAIIQTVDKKMKAISDDEIYTSLRKSLSDLVSSCVETSYSQAQLLSDLHNQLPLIETLIQLAKNFSDAFAQEKRNQACIDFDDMEKFAYQILYNEEHRIDLLYQRIFKEIMVDEFQDTNLIQNAIIEKVSSGNNIFRVGDVKQSIYKFRGAKPQLMREMSKQDEIMQIHLSNNYRSKQPIVSFNNHLFNLWMNLSETEDSYTEFDKVSTGRPEQNENGIPVSLDLIRGDMDDESSEDDIQLEDSANESIVKARHIAKTILELVESGQYQFKDMVILVRSHALKTSCKDAFDEVSIPYFIDTKSGFYQSDAIQHILNVLRFIANPNHDIALIGTLQSPLFGLTVDEIAILRNKQKERRVSWLNILESTYPQIYQTLVAWSQTFKTLTLHQSISELILHNQLYDVYCDHQDKTNVDFLLEKANRYDQTQQSGLLGFISMVEAIKDEKSSEAIPVSSSENVVKVMTIHQSKGLQFPVVFFWTNNSQQILDKRKAVVVDEHLGMGLHTIYSSRRYKRSNILRETIEYKMTKEELEEQLRVLYVALTRAQNRMYLVGFSKKDLSSAPLSYTSFFKGIGTYGWLVSAMHQYPHASFTIRHVPIVQYIKPWIGKKKEDSLPLPVNTRQFVTKDSEVKRYSRKQPGALNLQGELAANELGSNLHLAIERLGMVPWSSQDIEQTEVLLNDQQKQQLIDFSLHPLTQSMYQYPSEHELAYHIRKNSTIESGFMDWVIIKEQSLILVDFKSDRNVTPDILIERHMSQIDRYKDVLSTLYPNLAIECYIYSFFLNQYVSI